MNRPRPKTEYMQKIVAEYRAAGQTWPTSAMRMAEWAIAQKLWEPRPRGLVKQCAHELANALREEYYTDPQGRRVRTKHALRDEDDDDDKQRLLWVGIFDASPGQMQAALQLRRHQIVGDCRQLRTDLDSYNDNQNSGEPIQMEFDFKRDLEELDHATAA